MTFLAPPDTPDVVYEFYAPFAHVEGKFEWCRLRTPTHGVFDAFILPGRSPVVAAGAHAEDQDATPQRRVVVYVDTEAGARFMVERFPECQTVRVQPGALRIEERDEGRTVQGMLTSREGPVRAARIVISAPVQKPRVAPYGGLGKPVWGSNRFTCWGVDLVLDGTATGSVEWAEGFVEKLDRVPALVTLGSFGRIDKLA